VTFERPAAIPSAITFRHEIARADRVVVAGDHEVRLVGIGVRVHEADDRNSEAMRLPNGEHLLLQVDDEHRVGLALHVCDAAEVGLELLEVGLHRDALLRRQEIELPVGLQAAEVVEVGDAFEIVRQFVSSPPSQRFET
jgi:hypothetical protein